MKASEFECVECGFRYEQNPHKTSLGWVRATQCPVCGSLYVKWLNYKEFCK